MAAAARVGRRATAGMLLIDHEDSFVHTLAGYIRTTGAEVTTCATISPGRGCGTGCGPIWSLLSPGPGRPEDFAMRETLDLL